jgi:biotin synthase-related radical SAM superfamily protein
MGTSGNDVIAMCMQLMEDSSELSDAEFDERLKLIDEEIARQQKPSCGGCNVSGAKKQPDPL